MAVTLAILALLAAAASIVLTVAATTRAGQLRGVVRAINSEPSRPGLHEITPAEQLAGFPAPNSVTVVGGSRQGAVLLAAAVIGSMLTLVTLLTASSAMTMIATLSLILSAYIGARFGAARWLHVDATRLRLRRWLSSADIPLHAVRGIGFVPGTRADARVWLALWCDSDTVAGLPESLTGTAAVSADVSWVRLGCIDAVSTVQLLQLRRLCATRWTVGDADGVPQAEPPDIVELFATAQQLSFDPVTGDYSVDEADVARVVRRSPSGLRRWRSLARRAEALPLTIEVRDSLLRTRWVLSKPEAAWKTAFYVTDRQGRRVGTLRPTTVDSRSYDLCGTDNQVVATLWPGDPRTTVVDTRGNIAAVWDIHTTRLSSGADPSTRPLCLLSPIVARFAGTTSDTRTGALDASTAALPVGSAVERPSDDGSVSEPGAAGSQATVPLPAESVVGRAAGADGSEQGVRQGGGSVSEPGVAGSPATVPLPADPAARLPESGAREPRPAENEPRPDSEPPL